MGQWFSWVGHKASGTDFKQRALLALALLCVAGAAAVCIDTLALIVRYFQPLFFWDQWLTIDQYIAFKKGELRISDLFSQYNEHRIAFPRLVFLLDFAYGQGRNIINIAATFIVQFLHALLLARLELQFHKNIISTFVVALIFVLLFNFGQSENFYWGFQVQFVGVYAAASLSFWWFAKAAQQTSLDAPAILYAAGAAFMAFVATYCMANGVLVCAILALLGLALRARAPLIIGAAVLTLGLAFAYFYDFQLTQMASPPGYALQHPLRVIIYVLGYIGGTTRGFGFTTAAVAGFIGVSLALFAAVRMVVARDPSPARAALIAIMAFIIATALVTASGRAFFGLEQALSSRYLTPACIFWSAQVIYWSSFVSTKSRNLAATLVFAVVGSIALVGAVRSHFEKRTTANDVFLALNVASDALLSGGDFPDALARAFPDPEVPRRLSAFLDEEHLSIFAWPEARLRGLRLSEAFATIDDQACLGAFDSAEAEPHGRDVIATGWAWDRRQKTSVRRLLFVNSQGVITGFASGGWRKAGMRKILPESRGKEIGWRGFAKLTDRGPVQAYAVLDSGRAACLIGEHDAPEEMVEIGAAPVETDLSTVGPIIPARRQATGSWTLNGYEPSVGEPPSVGEILGLWSGSDAGQGELTIGPFVAPTGAFALPIITGPSTGGQSITVRDAETGEAYVYFNPPKQPRWTALLLTLPEGKASRSLILVASDKGTDWGQWMAVGQPHDASK